MRDSKLGNENMSKVIPEPRFILIGGVDVEVPRIKVKQLTAVMKLVAPFLPVLRKEGRLDVPTLLLSQSEEVIGLLMAISEKPREWFDDMELDELIDYTTEVVEVNVDFFIQRVLPSALRAMGLLKSGLLEKAEQIRGLIPSTTSSNTDTPTGT